jgi:hypothetical protein
MFSFPVRTVPKQFDQIIMPISIYYNITFHKRNTTLLEDAIHHISTSSKIYFLQLLQ